LEATEELVRQHGEDLAAIILEPIPMNMGFVLPRKGFLQGLRRLCDEYNSLLIFDEVKTCGKFYGGAREAFGVAPDLHAMGKAIGGGLPIAAVAGRREVMEWASPGVVSHAGTFNSNPLSVAAAHAAMTKVLTPGAMKQASRLGDGLGKGYAEIAADAGLPVQVQYMGISGALHFTPKPVVDWRSFLAVDVSKWYGYWTAMLNRGIIPGGTGPDEQWTMAVTHTREEVEEHLESLKGVTSLIKEVDEQMPIVEAI
jgi:glutamate-1-semialdehyde 2,1-aminomutase